MHTTDREGLTRSLPYTVLFVSMLLSLYGVEPFLRCPIKRQYLLLICWKRAPRNCDAASKLECDESCEKENPRKDRSRQCL